MKGFIKKIKNIKKKIADNKPLKIITTIIKVILYVIFIAILLIIFAQKLTNNNFSIGGIRIYSVSTGSMVPVYEVGDIIVSKETDASEIKEGDDVTYLGDEGDFNNLVVTHRVISVREDGGEYYFVTKGVANEIADPEISYDQIYGRVIYKTVFFSWLGRIMSNKISYYVIFIIVALMVSFEVVRVIYNDEDDEDENEEE